ncbi:EamA family transporter [Winogradskyella psychrotolerans]|uniref:EamA family transporter n=1 Tax=Winogradskyella psychrotolerans TaxID=1344585 RepID=UPI0003F7916E|nr:EamA family transporter [Winogradskyella psychrotolerans]
MNEKSHSNHLLLLIVATVCLSTSGPLGKFIDMPTPVIIWWRSILALIILFFFCVFRGINLKVNNKKDRFTFLLLLY